MASTLAKKIGYIKDRFINAYWMLRNGKFKLILKSIYIEIQHRIRDIRAWIKSAKKLDDSLVPGSVFVDKRKVVPPSSRPTESQISASAPLQADPEMVAGELRKILSTFSFQDISSP